MVLLMTDISEATIKDECNKINMFNDKEMYRTRGCVTLSM